MKSSNSYLYHSGVLGMRWGVRRSRKAKVSVTKKGTKETTAIDKAKAPQHNKPIAKPIAKPKALEDMTNEEIQAYNTRKQLENTYKSLQPKPNVSLGRKFAGTVLNKVVAPVAMDIGRKYLTNVAMNTLKIPASPPPKQKTS